MKDKELKDYIDYIDYCILHYNEHIDNKYNPAKYIILSPKDLYNISEYLLKFYIKKDTTRPTGEIIYYQGLILCGTEKVKEGRVIVSSVYNDLIFEKVNK